MANYYMITEAGRRKSGIWGRLTRGPSPRAFDESEVLSYLARFPNTPRSLKQIYDGTSWQTRQKGIQKAIVKLLRRGHIEAASD